jgi:hypothetical protein
MLEILNAPLRYSGVVDTSGAYRGTFCYIKGFANDGEVLLDLPSSSANAHKALYPINKYYFSEDLSDTSDAVDKLKKGDTVVYYDHGEFVSDKWVPYTFGFTSAYWSVTQNLSSSYGSTIYYPGGSTAQANFEKHFCWLATGAGTGRKAGYLIGTSLSTFTSGTSTQARNGWVAEALAFYYESSANAKIRFRIVPGHRPYAA